MYWRGNIWLISLLFVVLLISCSSDRQMMRYTSWQSSPTEEKIIRSTLEEFRDQHPETAFTFEPIPGNYTEKLQLMLGTGNAPDLFWLKADTYPAYTSFDVLEPLESYYSSDEEFDIDDFFPAFRQAFEYKGQTYGFAKDFNAYVLFYNEDMLAEAGLERPPQNWAELLEYSRLLTKDKDGDGRTDQYGFVVEPSIDLMLPFIYQNGGQIVNEANQISISSQAAVDAMQYVLNLYREGVATIPGDVGAGRMGDVFSRRQCAMAISGAWLIPYLQANAPDLNYQVAELPVGKEKATIAFSVAMVIPRQSEFKDDAWTMMRYLTSKEGMTSWTESGIALPTRKSVAEANGFYQDSTLSVFMNSVDYAKLFKVNLQERWFDDTQATIQGIFYKDRDIGEALTELSENLEKYKLD